MLGWPDPKWQVPVANQCMSRIKFSFGHSASQPGGVKIYESGVCYTKRF